LDKNYLIGYDPIITDFSAGDQVIVGWLSKKRALPWNTRQALYFNKSNFANRLADDNLGLIFRSKEDARAWYLEGKRPGETEGGAPLMRESREVMSELPFDWPRFPILEKPTRLSPDLDTRIFKIAFFGDTITSTGQIVPREAIWEGRSELRRLQDEVKNIDLHFVLDTLVPMRVSFPQVKRAIEATMRMLRSEYSELRVRFSLVLFKGCTDRNVPDSHLVKHFQLTEDPTPLLEMLTAMADGAGGGDGPAASFHAVQKSLEWGDPRPGTMSALFLITDTPNKDEGAALRSMVDRLKQHRTSFFPVIHETSPAAIEEARRAEDLLTRQVRSPCAGRVIVTDFRSDNTSAKIVEAIEDTFNDSRDLQRLFMGVHSGSVTTGGGDILHMDGRPTSQRMSALFHELMKDANIPPELFAEKQVQILDEGYIVDSIPGRDRYRLHEGCLERLERDLVDPSVIVKLRKRAGDRIYSEEEFDREFIGILSADERRCYESVIKDIASMDKLVESYVLVDHETLIALYSLISWTVKQPIKRENIRKFCEQVAQHGIGANTLTLGDESRIIADLVGQYEAQLVREGIFDENAFPSGIVKEEILRMTLLSPDELALLSSEEIWALYERLRMKRDLLADIISEQAVAYQFEDGVFTGTVNRGSKHYFFLTMYGDTRYAWIKREYLP